MLKVIEWLLAGAATFAVWIAAVLKVHTWNLSGFEKNLVLYFPVIAVFLFGIASVSIIAYRVATFRDCPEAAKELQEQIEDARIDLKQRGFKF